METTHFPRKFMEKTLADARDIAVVILVTQFLWDCTAKMRKALALIAASAPAGCALTVHVGSALSETAHGVHPGANVRPRMDFAAFAGDFAGAAGISAGTASFMPMIASLC